jgi:hypothetical protein
MKLPALYNLLAIIFIPTFAYAWLNTVARSMAKGRKGPIRPSVIVGWIVVVCCGGGIAGISSYMAGRARSAVIARLKYLGEPYTVRVNGAAVRDPDAVVVALRAVRDVPAHHSSPQERLHVDVEGRAGSFELIIARDSERADEYWVYLPEDDPVGNPPGGNEIGRVTVAPGDIGPWSNQ